MENTEYRKDVIIFRQGDYAEVMYEILSGSIGIYTSFGTKYEKQIAVLQKGQLFGEMGVIDAYPRSATAVTMENGTRLKEISEDEFSDYFFDQPERVLQIMRQISQRLRERTEDCRKAQDTLQEMKGTRGEPEKRSKSLRERIREFFKLYDEMAAAGLLNNYDNMYY